MTKENKEEDRTKTAKPDDGRTRRKADREYAFAFRMPLDRKEQLHRLADRLSGEKSPPVSFTETLYRAMDALDAALIREESDKGDSK